MTRFTFTGDYDAYGQPRRQATLAVPRHRDYRAPAPAGAPYLGTIVETRFAERDDAQRYIVNRVSESASFEIVNDGSLAIHGLYRAIQSDRAARKLFDQSFNYYDGEAFVGLPFGQLGDFGALVRTESLVLTEEILRDVYRDPADPDGPHIPAYLRVDGVTDGLKDYPKEFQDQTAALAGYVFADGSDHRARGYFAQATRVAFDFHKPGTPQRGLVVARRDPLGHDTAVVFDEPYHLLPLQLTDAAGLTTSAEYDYRVLQARMVTDANGNRTAVSFSPLGLVKATAVMGKADETAGDTLEAPGSRLEYDFSAFANRQQPVFVRHIAREHHVTDTDVPLPARNATIETIEYSDGFGRLLQTRTQTDDVLFGSAPFGGDVLPADQPTPATDVVKGRRKAEGAPNVIVSGWQIYDNKGRPVEVYEPFFSTDFAYEPARDAQFGQKSTMFYDPRGEMIRTLNPDGSEQRVVHGIPTDLSKPDQFTPTPWEAYSYDANDLAPVSRGPDGVSLAGVAPATHHFTPSSIVIDALGRTVTAIARTRDAEDDSGGALSKIQELHTQSTYDIRGNVLTVTDPLNRIAFGYAYDLADRPWRIESLDAGLRRIVLNPVDAEVERRDSKGALVLQTYDALQRPTRLWARDDASSPIALRQRMEYGDAGRPDQDASERGAMRERNLLGQLTRHHDEAGLTTLLAVDFKGNMLDKSRRVIADAPILAVFEQAPANAWRVTPFQVDWQTRPQQTLADRERELLEASAYRTTGSFDALSRVKRMQFPDDVEAKRRELRTQYNRAGGLRQLRLDDTVYVERIAYDAAGQRTLIAYGNGVMTRYAYDPRTSRLARLRSERYTKPDDVSYRPSGESLQDFGYDYDLAGNIVSIRDRTPGSGFRNNPEAATTVDPALAQLLASGNALNRRFEYDSLYRLLSATGRECDRPPNRPPWDHRPRCADLTKARAYTERYAYDSSGNTLRLEHRNDTGGFSRTFTIETLNNRVRRMEIGDLDIDYAFDANGNTRSETTSRHFEWNHRDQLKVFRTQTEGAEPTVHAHYLYDAAGRRVKKLVRTQGGDVEVTQYVEGVLEHHRWRGGQNNHLHIGDDVKRIALVRVGPAHPDAPGPAVQFCLADHLGSSNVVTDSRGVVIDREEFTPYGETSFGSFARKRYRFTGCERDEESGLSYHGNRYYAPGLTRFSSCDPLGIAGGLNSYAYAVGNPLGLIDPSGTQPAEPPRDADGNYIAPPEVIRVNGKAPYLDELEIQKRAGNSHYDSRAEVERQLRFQLRNTASDYSWLHPPPGPDWDAEGLPELAEEARAEAEAKWDDNVTKEYQKRRDAKVVELGKQQRRISAANTAGKVIAGVTLVGVAVVGGAAAGVGTGLTALKGKAAVAIGRQVATGGAAALAGSIAYGIAAPPGAPDLPGTGDNGGRVVRGLLSRLVQAISNKFRGRRGVIANPTFEDVKALAPRGMDFREWGAMIWGTGRDGAAAEQLLNRTAAQLRQIPCLTLENAQTLRNWLSQLPTGVGGVAPANRVPLLDQIIRTLQGG